MGHDSRQYVQPGQPLRIAASQINALNKLSRTPARMNGVLGNQWPPASNVVLAKNMTGKTVPRFGVMAFGEAHAYAANSTDDFEASFSSCPALKGVIPTGGDAAWGVAVDPIRIGEIGRVAVGGAVLARVDVSDDRHTRVQPANDAVDVLESCFVGGAAILSRITGVSDGQLCVIHFCGPERSVWIGRTHEIVNPGDTESVYVMDDAGEETGDVLDDVANLTSTPVFDGITVTVVSCDGRKAMISSQMPSVLRGSATGDWSKGTDKSVSVTIAEGSPAVSITAKNWFAAIENDNEYSVAVAWSQDNWILIAAEC